MRTTPALRTLAAALLTGGALAVSTAGTTAAAAPPTYPEGHGSGGDGGGGPVWGTVVSRTDLNLRQAPTTHSPAVDSLSPGSQDRVQCRVLGQSVNGDPDWYWLVGAQAWASAAFVDTGGAWPPTCADPCPQWKNGTWTNWDDPFWNDAWSVSVSGSFSVTVSGSSSGGWDWVPVGR
ncbi:SH3 domain-containing protein [Streptomyces sp. NBC_01275]|uniref:SH3 domain-containing protein n=1 Tax=Streptomyces sp. NBC_01275 TaxID=2903807 RepID=UPI002255E7C6|nr:SH3 domain-containing protein [Streptomyces sp. NBC_01275]MCX4763548.1 SH3 domain-containing protein [Streptomyces sp. NBC_01275]